MSASGGGHGSLDSKSLKLTVVSPLVGKSFMEAAQRVCLESYPSVVPLFNKGIMPIEMLEFDPPYSKRSLLARKEGTYFDIHMQPILVSQTAIEYRKELIVQAERESNCSSAQAIKLHTTVK